IKRLGMHALYRESEDEDTRNKSEEHPQNEEPHRSFTLLRKWGIQRRSKNGREEEEDRKMKKKNKAEEEESRTAAACVQTSAARRAAVTRAEMYETRGRISSALLTGSVLFYQRFIPWKQPVYLWLWCCR
ncbi:unnamed protein product, partial [Rangifer tarandus platyrhynchus]